jgi:hypothetical protein
MTRTLQEEMTEARHAQAAGDLGRGRTCARRAAGMAIQSAIGIGPHATDYAPTYVEGLRRLAAHANLPKNVREAAGRLVDRVDKEGQSASQNPVQDAQIIVDFFLETPPGVEETPPQNIFPQRLDYVRFAR